MEKIMIKAEARAEHGTAAVRRLRRTGKIPASVMKMNKGGTQLIALDAHEFMMAMRGRSGKQLLVALDMNGSTTHALLREMQNDVLAGTPIHVDFSEVSLTQKVRVTVPLYLTGEATGVKLGGGVLEQVLLAVEHLGGEHMPVVLCDEIGLAHIGGHGPLGLAAGVFAAVRKVIVGVDILE